MQFICESNSFQRWSNVVVNCANRAITIVVNEYEFSRIIFGRFAIVFTYFSLARLRQFDVRTFASQEYRYRYATAFKSRTDVSKEDVPEAEGNNLVRNNLVIFTDQFLDQLHQSHAHFRFSNRANTRVEIMTHSYVPSYARHERIGDCRSIERHARLLLSLGQSDVS